MLFIERNYLILFKQAIFLWQLLWFAKSSKEMEFLKNLLEIEHKENHCEEIINVTFYEGKRRLLKGHYCHDQSRLSTGHGIGVLV